MSVTSILGNEHLIQERIAYLEDLGVELHDIDRKLLMTAFIHKSYAADFGEHTAPTHNERLEFLGDSVLGCVVAKLLYTDFPNHPESQLTLSKIFLVKEGTLAKVAKNIRLGQQIFIGNGEEKSGGRTKASILSDTLEAIICYLYLDQGRECVESFVKKHIYTVLDSLEVLPQKSYKSQLQELIQKKRKQIPEYTDYIVSQEPSGNVVTYGSTISLHGEDLASGQGPSKKKAQECAAQKAYELLE